MYPEYGSLKSGHQAHFYGRMCAKSSCIWQCRGRHLVLAAASPNAMPGLNFSGFCCKTENGPKIAGFGASRAAKKCGCKPQAPHLPPAPHGIRKLKRVYCSKCAACYKIDRNWKYVYELPAITKILGYCCHVLLFFTWNAHCSCPCDLHCMLNHQASSELSKKLCMLLGMIFFKLPL